MRVRSARFGSLVVLSLAVVLITGVVTSVTGFVTIARASMVEALDLDGLVERAEHVVVARVMKQWSHYDGRGRIVTDVQMQVEQAEKGDTAPGTGIVVRRLGGVVDGIGMRIDGEPSFEDGELVLLFGTRSAQEAALRPVGMSQGAMRIREQSGQRWVHSAAQGAALVKRDLNGALTRAQVAVAQPRKLDEVLGEIRSIVAKKKR